MTGKFKFYLREAFESLYRTKNFILISAALFIFGVFLGFFIYLLSPDNEFFRMLISQLENIGSEFGGKSVMEGSVFLFIHNFQAVFVSMISGFFLIFPLLFILVNGTLIGFFFGVAGNPALFIALIPHGVFELPAFLIGTGAGMRIGFVILMPDAGKTRIESMRDAVTDAFKILILITPLLLIAAVIEVTISAALAKMLV